MAKVRKPLKHDRIVKKTSTEGFVYTEQRGMRSFRFETGQTDDRHRANTGPSENPADKARFLVLAASRFLTKAGEKDLMSVLKVVKATQPNDEDQAFKSAVQKWLAGLIHKYGVLSPITVAAQFLSHQYSIVEKLTWFAEGAPDNVISDDTAETISKQIAELFPAIYALCDAWHWWQMELHGDHARLIDAQVIKASRIKGASSNRDKKQQRELIIANVFDEYALGGGRLDILASDIAQKIKQEAKNRCAKNKPDSLNFISDDQLTRIVRHLVKRS